jgi:holin-like protein
MIQQLAILFAFLAMGEAVVALTAVPVPSSIIGMILLTVALRTGLVSLHRVELAANFLLKNMGFFFVPAGVGLMNYLGLLSQQWVPIVTATVVSTFVIFAVTGHIHQRMRKLGHHGISH